MADTNNPESLKISIDSCDGTEPYLFVSYSHKDTPAVDGALIRLDEKGFRLWYDDTMEVGSDFREELRRKIEDCCGLLLFVSGASMQSKFCGMEIITAFKHNKRIYPVYLDENVDIPAPIKMVMENLQHVKGDLMEDKYMAKLVDSLPFEARRNLDRNGPDGDILVKCKDGSPSIRIPSGIKEIGKAAFKNCEKLEEVDLGDEVHTLHSEAFRGCKKLRAIRLPKNVKIVGDSAFRDCIALQSVTVENDNIELGERAFENCAGLTEIHLPAGMSELYGGVFNSCKALTAIAFPRDLTVLGESSLADCIKLVSVEMPDSLSKIDDMVFNGCIGLEQIVLNDGLTKIGKNAFKDCSSLKGIRIPASVTSIGIGPFRGCLKLSEIAVDPKSKSFKAVENILFNKSKSELICFPSCSPAEEYVIPDSVTSISDWAFCGCKKLVKIAIPDSVYSIGEGAFYNCSGLQTVVLPDSVTRIDDVAFRGCTNLVELAIPDSVTEFGWGVLNGCENVKVVCSAESKAAEYCERKKIPHSEA